MKSFDGRTSAARILDAVAKRKAYADHLIDKALTGTDDPREAALATALVYGVLRHAHRLDRFIEKAAGRPMAKIHPKLVSILRVGAFQILEMDRIPARAAVDSAVTDAKNSGQAHAAGFVNAVLRRIADGSAVPDTPEDEAGRLSLTYSLPQWLSALLIEREGLEGAKLMAGRALREPPVFLRLDTRRMSRDEALSALSGARESGPGFYAPESVWISGGSDPKKLLPVARKNAVVQEQASQLIAPLLEPEPGMRILDACAAPGMKALHLARLMDGKGSITALEIHPHRAEKMKETAAAMGFSNIRVITADAALYDGEPGFDAALVDAPCSGLGVLSRNPERKWTASPDDPARLNPLQSAILDNVSRLVKPGGLLLYATCTFTREENEDVARSFLERNQGFLPDPPKLPAGLEDGEGNLRTYPHDDKDEPGRGLDGFFAARFRRRVN